MNSLYICAFQNGPIKWSHYQQFKDSLLLVEVNLQKQWLVWSYSNQIFQICNFMWLIIAYINVWYTIIPCDGSGLAKW